MIFVDIFSSSLEFELNFNIATGIGSVLPLVISILSSAKDFKGKIDNSLDKVYQLNGYYFEWNDVAKNLDGGKSFKEGVEVGVSAQEIEKVLPEVVTEAPIVKIENLDVDYKTVYYDKIVPLLIEAIKELRAEVKKLKEDK